MTRPGRLTRSTVRELLSANDLSPSRALGQNFLCDGPMVDKIVRLAGVEPGDRVVEIGAGLGSLTLGLADRGATVLALEIDRYLMPPLSQVVDGLDVSIHHADAREFDWATHLGGESWKVVANLPYNIATPLILELLAAQPLLERWLVMVQREAGDRLVATPGPKSYGIPSVLAAYWAEARIVGSVKPELFLPQPKVDSVLVELVRHTHPPADASFDRISTLVRAGFGQRRKMLRRSLSSIVTSEQLAEAGIEPTARAEELDLAAWNTLAKVAP